MRLSSASIGILRYQGNLMRPAFVHLSILARNVVGFCDLGAVADGSTRVGVMSDGNNFHHIGMESGISDHWPPKNKGDLGLLINLAEAQSDALDRQKVTESVAQLAGHGCAKLMIISGSSDVLKFASGLAPIDFLGVKVSPVKTGVPSSAAETIAKAAAFFFDTPQGVRAPSLLDIAWD